MKRPRVQINLFQCTAYHPLTCIKQDQSFERHLNAPGNQSQHCMNDPGSTHTQPLHFSWVPPRTLDLNLNLNFNLNLNLKVKLKLKVNPKFNLS